MRRFAEALAAFKRRVVMSPGEVKSLGHHARTQAFWIAGANQLNIVQQVYDAIGTAIKDGLGYDSFKKQISAALTRTWGGENPARVETIARNAIQTAYSAGRWRQLEEPAVKAFRPYRLFDAVMDSRTTQICKPPMHGTVLPADDPWWRQHVPPLHHRCRSGIRSLRASEALRRGIAVTPPKVKAQTGFGRMPGHLWTPDFSEIDPVLARELRRKVAANDNA